MKFEVYCDESRTELLSPGTPGREGKYLLIGGLWLPAERRKAIKSRIGELREQHHCRAELKWNKVSPSRQGLYEDLIKLFFNEPDLRFRAVAIRADQVDLVRFHDGDAELAFYKFYYLLLRYWFLDFNEYTVFVDLRTNRLHGRLKTLKEILDRSNRFADVEAVQALPSDQLDLLQLADLLLGAVGSRLNEPTRGVAKEVLVGAIERRLGHPIRATPKSEEKFNVFVWRPGGGW